MSFDTGFPSSESFASYEADYKLTVADITQKLEAVLELTGEARRAGIDAASRAVDEADEILGQLQRELNSLPTSMRPRLKPRLRNYTASLDRLRCEMLKLEKNVDRRGRGRGGGGTSWGDAVVDQRILLLGATERLEHSSQRISASERLANETEAVGAGILSCMRGQSETLLNTHDTLDDNEQYLDRNLKTLRGMGRRYPLHIWVSFANADPC